MTIIPQTYKWAYALTKRSAKITRIILHHAAAKTCTAQQIHSWHVANKWAGIGYHYFVRKDGSIYKGRPDDMVGAHAGNNNSDSIGICFEGNFDTEQMSDVQKKAGVELVTSLKKQYGINKIQKHSDVNATGCPGKNFPFQEIANGEVKSVQNSAEAKMVITVSLPQLSKGTTGSAVKLLQELLKGKGYDLGTYGADGDFGDITLMRVKNFQSASGLPADGIVGKNTWNKLLYK